MNIIKLSGVEVNYPIGEYMEETIGVVKKLVEEYLKHETPDKPINVFCMGSSGAIMAAIFATIVPNVTILHIKKDGEDTHSKYFEREIKNFCKKENLVNIIIDDSIVSGKTLNSIYSKLYESIIIDYLILGYGRDIEYKLGKIDFKPNTLIYTNNRD